MSELEKIEREYRALATKLAYQGFRGGIDPTDQRRLESLSDQRVSLSAPDLRALSN